MSEGTKSVLAAVAFIAFWVGWPIALWYAARGTEARADDECAQVCEFVGSSGHRFNRKCVCADGTTPLRGFGR